MPNSGKPIATLKTAQDAAIPDSNATCAAPIVDFEPTNSDIIRTPTMNAGTERAATVKSDGVFARSRTASHEVTAM
jgi:hypothetical protein